MATRDAIRNRVNQIKDLAQNIEDVPNFGPDIWSTGKIDNWSRQIQADALWVAEGLLNFESVGPGQPPPGVGPPGNAGSRSNKLICERLRRIHSLAREIEDVPNFGVDLWSMREIDQRCRAIKGHCDWILERVTYDLLG